LAAGPGVTPAAGQKVIEAVGLSFILSVESAR
jgi:hypothetical protein